MTTYHHEGRHIWEVFDGRRRTASFAEGAACDREGRLERVLVEGSGSYVGGVHWPRGRVVHWPLTTGVLQAWGQPLI